MSPKQDPEKIVREIKRKTRRKFSAEEKIRIVLEGLRGEETIAELCRRERIAPNLYCSWSKEFLEAGKRWARRQVEGLIEGGAPCIHFYVMNDAAPAVSIVKDFV
jgi:transposase-like protein